MDLEPGVWIVRMITSGLEPVMRKVEWRPGESRPGAWGRVAWLLEAL